MKNPRSTKGIRAFRRWMLPQLAATLLLLPTSPVRAAIVSWTNTAGGNWSVPANWSTGALPREDDEVLITAAGNYTVTLNVNATIGGLRLGAPSGTQTLAIVNRVLTLNGNGDVKTNGWLRLTSGDLSGSNHVSLGGVMSWQSGAIDTNASLVVAPGGSVTLASAGNEAKLLYGNLTNAGVVTFSTYGSLTIGGTFHNLAGGLFDAQTVNRSILKAGDTALFINDGVFRKSVSAENINCSVPLHNRGTVDNQTGTLMFLGGSVLESGSAFVGAGLTTLAGGTHALNGTLYATNLMLSGATLAGTGRLSGLVTWEYGTIAAGATVTVASDGHLLMSSGGNLTRYVEGNLINAGTVTFSTYGNLSLGGTFHNLPGALFDVQTVNRSIWKSGDNAVFINDGVFRRSLSTSTIRCEVPVVNNGTVEALAGTLEFEDAFDNPSGTISLAGGTVRMTQPLLLAGGLLTGWGTLDADVTNDAVVRPDASNGVLTVQGNYTQTIRGTTEFDLAGNNPGVNQGRLNITGAAKLAGSVGVRLADGFLPNDGMSFPVISFASRTGEYTCLNGFFLLSHERRLLPLYGATALTLATVAAPDPTNVSLKVAFGDAALVCWPAEFTGWSLYWNTNLTFTNWHLVPEATHRFVDTDGAPEKFYRLQRP